MKNKPLDNILTGIIILFILLSLVIISIFFFPGFKSFVEYSGKFFGVGIHNGELLTVIFNGITAISISLGLFFGFFQIKRLHENNINEKYKTALELFNSNKDGMGYCAIHLLHNIAMQSNEHIDIVKHILVKYINGQIVSPIDEDKLKCAHYIFDHDEYKNIGTKSILEKTTFRNFSLTNTSLENFAFLNDCSFESIIFTNVVFNDVIFKDVTFKGVSFDESKFNNCTFENVKFLKVQDDAIESEIVESVLTGARFNNCTIKKTSLNQTIAMYIICDENTRFRDVDFENCSLYGSLFDGSSLTRCKFDDTDMTDAKYPNAKIKDCDFIKAINPDAEFLNKAGTLRGSIFTKNIMDKLDKRLYTTDYLTEEDNLDFEN